MRLCAQVTYAVVVVSACACFSRAESLVGKFSPVYVEDSPAAQELADKAQRLRRQQRLGEAVRIYQQIIDEHADKIIALDDDLYIGAARWVRLTVGADPALLKAYRGAHEPLAQRMAGDGTNTSAADLSKLWSRYTLCRAALEAALRLAALHLEAGRTMDAAVVLDDVDGHPDLALHQARFALLQAASGLYSGDSARLEKHRNALQALDDPQHVAQLEDWTARLRLPRGGSSADAHRLPDPAMPESFGKPLWSVLVSQDGRDVTTVTTTFGTDRSVPPGNVRTPRLQPVAQGESIYLVGHDSVIALDRNYGAKRWVYVGSADAAAMAKKRQGSVSAGWLTARSACVVGGRVIAVVGLPDISSGNVKPSTSLVCLDSELGNEIWRIESRDLPQSLSTAFFDGSALAAGNRIMVTMRRASRRSLQDAYLVAFDLHSGELIWRRHLVSANMKFATHGGRSPTQWLLHAGRLYVSDILGAAACLDSRDGSVIWINRLPMLSSQQRRIVGVVPAGRAHPVQSSNYARPIARPILVEAGLVVSSFDRQKPPVLVDPQTGRVKRQLDTGPAWDGASYYIQAGGDIVSVGDGVRLVDGQSFKVIRHWQLPEAVRGGKTGVAAVTQSRILLPVASSLVEIDRSEDQVKARHELAGPGSVLLLDGQAIIAGRRHVHSYMHFAQGYDRLEQQIADNPQDPRPALALTHMALVAGKSQQVLQAADAALAALNRRAAMMTPGPIVGAGQDDEPDPMHHEVFRRLLGFAHMNEAAELKLRGALFERLATAAVGPADTVEYHLALGKFLDETGRYDQAVERYQLVLNDQTLSRQLHHWEDGRRRAALEARLRQADLVKRHPRIYQRYEDMASQRLAHLETAADSHWGDYVTLANQYPLSRGAAEARMAAARILLADGDRDACVHQLRLAYATTRRPGPASRIVSRLVSLYQDAGQPRRARTWLLRWKMNHPDRPLTRDEKPITADRWLVSLDLPTASPQTTARFALPLGPPRKLTGQLLTALAQQRSDWPGDLFALQRGRQLSLCQGADFQPRWTVDIGPGKVELWSLDVEQVIFYLSTTGLLSGLDAQTGRELWPPIRINKLLMKVGHAEAGDGGQDNVVLLRQRGFDKVAGVRIRPQARARGRMFKAVNDRMICVSNSTGHLVGIDRRTGQQHWARSAAVKGVARFQMDDDLLVLGGSHGTRHQAGALIGLDPTTGRLQFKKDLDRVPRWVHLGDDATLLCTTARRVVSYGARKGKLNWYVTVPNTTITGPGYLAGSNLLLAGRGGTWQILDLVDNKQPHRFTSPLPLPAQGRAVLLKAGADRWFVVSRRAAAIDVKGRVLWRDAIHGEGKSFVAQFLSRRHVLLLAQLTSGRAGGPLTYRLYLLDRNNGSILLDDYQIGPLDQKINVAESRLIDDHLLLATTSQTLVVPAAKPLP